MTTEYDEDLYRLKNYRGQHHGGLGWDYVKITNERTAKARLRSKPDKRLFDSMEPHHEVAFMRIKAAHMLLTRGMGFSTMRLDGGSSGTGPGAVEAGATLMAHYRAWRDLCKARHISGLMAEDVIVAGFSLNESDTERKMRKGTAKDNLFKCLQAWHDVTDEDIQAALNGTGVPEGGKVED